MTDTRTWRRLGERVPSWVPVATFAGLGVAAAVLIVVGVPPVVAAAVLVAPVAVAVGVARPDLGLVVLVFVTYSRVSDVLIEYHGLPSVAQPLVAVLLAVVLARWLALREEPTGWMGPLQLVAAFGLVLVVSLYAAVDMPMAYDVVGGFARDAVLVLVVVLLFQRGEALPAVIWSLLAVGIALGTLGIWQYMTGGFATDFGGFAQAPEQHIFGRVDDHRIAGPVGDPNYFGQILVVLVPLALGRLRDERALWLRGLALWALVATVVATVLTYSRGALFALVVVAVALLVSRPPRLRTVALGVAAAAVALATLGAPEGYGERIESMVAFVPGIGGPAHEPSLGGRMSALAAGWGMFADHPVIGVGPGQFVAHFRPYTEGLGMRTPGAELRPHNLYVEMAAEHGLVGLVVFGVLLAGVFAGLRDARRRFRRAGAVDYASMTADLRIGILGYLAGAVFIHAAYPRYMWLLFALALALPAAARHEETRVTEGEASTVAT